MWTASAPHVSCSLWQPLQICQVRAEVLWVDVRNLLWLIDQLIAFPSISMCPGTHISLILLCSSSFTKDWCQSHTNLEFVFKLSSALMASWLSEKDVDVSTSLALFWIPHYTSLNGIYFSLKYFALEPKTKALPPSWTPVSVPVLVLDPSLYQTRPPLLSGCNPFCHSHLSGNLWHAYLGSILSNPLCNMVLCSISQNFLVWPKLVDVGLHCWIHISL